MRRVTVNDIAAEAGVGRSTVSRALRGDPRCNRETAERVRAVAERLGYRPDPALSALVSHRDGARRGSGSYNIGVVDESAPGGDFYRKSIWASVSREAEALGYAVEWLSPNEFEHPRQLARVAEARGVRGLIWGWLYDERYLVEFPWERFAHIGFLLPVVRPSIHRVRDDAFRTVFDATRAVFDAGFERPGLLILTSPGSTNDRFQSAGWLQAHAELGKEPIAPIFCASGASLDSMRRLVSVNVDCLVCNSAEGLFWTARDHGLELPMLNLLHGSPHFPGFDCSEDQIGQALVTQLDGQLRRNDLGLTDHPRTTLVKRVFREQARLATMHDASSRCESHPG